MMALRVSAFGVPFPRRSLGGRRRVQNVLTGRAFPNWRDQMLKAGTVYNVAFAATAIFTGNWLSVASHFSVGALLGSVRKEIKEYGDLHKVSKNMQKSALEHVAANARHRALLSKFGKQLSAMDKQNAQFRENNKTFKESNETYKHHLETHESHNREYANLNDRFSVGLDKLGGYLELMKDAIAKGHKVSEKILKKAMKQLAEERRLLRTMHTRLKKSNQAYASSNAEHRRANADQRRISSNFKRQVKAIISDARNLNAALYTKADTLEQRCRATASKLAEEVEKLERVRATHKQLQTEVGRLKTEVDHLETVRGSLQSTAGNLAKASAHASVSIGRFEALFERLMQNSQPQ